MTKVIILGQEPEKKELKPIEFVKYLSEPFGYRIDCLHPREWKNIELICKDYLGKGFDFMYAYNDDRQDGFLHLGYFNDGIV